MKLSLSVGQRATFKAKSGQLVTGKVYAITATGLYLVLSDEGLCYTYTDGFYRFQEHQVVGPKPISRGRPSRNGL